MSRSFCIFLLCVIAFSAYADVTVEINAQRWHYKEPPRLSTVLAPVALQQDWYWPAASLFSLSDTSAEAQRQAVQRDIEHVKALQNTQLQAALSQLSYHIAGWQLATRRPIAIDYNLARINNRYNPAFDTGDYLLQLTTRPQTVQFWGAVDQILTLPHAGVTPVIDYLPAIGRSSVADLSYVLIITPSGEVKQVGVASWNQQYIELMPGASVFVPFAGGLLSADLMQLNKDIASLARHRVK